MNIEIFICHDKQQKVCSQVVPCPLLSLRCRFSFSFTQSQPTEWIHRLAFCLKWNMGLLLGFEWIKKERGHWTCSWNRRFRRFDLWPQNGLSEGPNWKGHKLAIGPVQPRPMSWTMWLWCRIKSFEGEKSIIRIHPNHQKMFCYGVLITYLSQFGLCSTTWMNKLTKSMYLMLGPLVNLDLC